MYDIILQQLVLAAWIKIPKNVFLPLDFGSARLRPPSKI